MINNENDYLENEMYVLEDLKKDLKILEGKWFKTKRTTELIEFSKKYIKLKEKLIEDIKNFNKT